MTYQANAAPNASPYASPSSTCRMAAFRIGQGYDAHRLTENRPLILGGVSVPFDKGLAGHSDADVLIHAVMDALLGAAGLDDIGTHFPDSDARYKNISSLNLLMHVKDLLTRTGYAVVNIDAVLLAQQPKLAPFRAEMAHNIASVLDVSDSDVNIKATTEEGMGFTGAGEGIAAHAVCLLERL